MLKGFEESMWFTAKRVVMPTESMYSYQHINDGTLLKAWAKTDRHLSICTSWQSSPRGGGHVPAPGGRCA